MTKQMAEKKIRIRYSFVEKHLSELWKMFPALKNSGDVAGVLTLCDLGLKKLKEGKGNECTENYSEPVSRLQQPRPQATSAGEDWSSAVDEAGPIAEADPLANFDEDDDF